MLLFQITKSYLKIDTEEYFVNASLYKSTLEIKEVCDKIKT